jgi:inhibitor of cysteine peptidase
MRNSKLILATLIMAGLFNSPVFADAVVRTPRVELPIYTQDKLAAVVTSDQPEFVIKLKSNPTTGYSWFLRDYNFELIVPISHVFEPAEDKKLLGAPGYETWIFKAKPAAFVVPQQTSIRFVYARPWETGEGSMQLMFKVSMENKK